MTSPTPAVRPPGRYGDRPRGSRRGPVVATVALATAFVGWVVWAALGAMAPALTGQVTRFVVPGPQRIEVQVAVAGPPGAVTCRLRAFGRDSEVVGATTVRGRLSPAGRLETTVAVRTRSRAVTAVLDGCTRPGGR